MQIIMSPGGCTHAFENKGFEFDIGIHYIGNMEDGSMNRVFIDYLTNGQLKWQPIQPEYDHAIFDEGDQMKWYGVCQGKDEYKRKLKEQFPAEGAGIDKFFKLMQRAKAAGGAYLIVKVLPLWLMKLLVKLNLHKLVFGEYLKLSSMSLKQVLDDITTDKKLKAVLSYCFGDYGTPPSQTSFIMHAMLFNHFLRSGGFYPVGGASEIAYQMIPVIEESGGVVLGGVSVDKILVEDGKVFGVRVSKFDRMEIRAPIVISNAGIFNTYQSLLTPQVARSYGFLRELEQKKVGHACLQVFVGLDGTAEELGLVAKNYWIFTSYDQEKDMNEYLGLEREEAANREIPLLFASFPSTKDPTWQDRYPGKSTCAIVTFSKHSWFAEWSEDNCKRRGNTYDELKTTFAEQAWKQVVRNFPQLEGKVAHMEAGSPLTHDYYINSTKGEIYGLDHTRDRFDFEKAMTVRPDTPIRNLYLTGQDVFTCGFIGAAFGGLITASKVLDRLLIIDLIKVLGEARKKK